MAAPNAFQQNRLNELRVEVLKKYNNPWPRTNNESLRFVTKMNTFFASQNANNSAEEKFEVIWNGFKEYIQIALTEHFQELAAAYRQQTDRIYNHFPALPPALPTTAIMVPNPGNIADMQRLLESWGVDWINMLDVPQQGLRHPYFPLIANAAQNRTDWGEDAADVNNGIVIPHATHPVVIQQDPQRKFLHYKTVEVIIARVMDRKPPPRRRNEAVDRMNKIIYHRRCDPRDVFDAVRLHFKRVNTAFYYCNIAHPKDVPLAMLTDAEKSHALHECFYTNNNLKIHNNQSEINRLVKNEIPKHTLQSVRQWANIMEKLVDRSDPEKRGGKEAFDEHIWTEEEMEVYSTKRYSGTKHQREYNDPQSPSKLQKRNEICRNYNAGICKKGDKCIRRHEYFPNNPNDTFGRDRGRGRGRYRGRGRGRGRGRYRGRGRGRNANKTCHNCHKQGHIAADCWQNKRQTPTGTLCSKCGKGNHHPSNCWSRRDMNGKKLNPSIPPTQRPQVYGYANNRTKPQNAQHVAQNNQNARDQMYHIAVDAAHKVFAQQRGMIVPDELNAFPVLDGDHPNDAHGGQCPQ